MTGSSDGECTGVDAFIRGVSACAWANYLAGQATSRFVAEISERYAYIRLQDISSPIRFLRQMAGAPPEQFGDSGFRAEFLDDYNPARHYTAFVYMGYQLPMLLAVLSLFIWEVAGFVRYKGDWSWPDIRSGMLGIRHGRFVRRFGPTVLPGLIASQLAERDTPLV